MVRKSIHETVPSNVRSTKSGCPHQLPLNRFPPLTYPRRTVSVATFFDPLPPPVFPEVLDLSVQADMDKEPALNDWVTVTVNFSSIAQLYKAFQDARRKAEVYYDMYSDAGLAAASDRKQVEHLTAESRQLRSSLDRLNRTHNSLMADSLRHLEEISYLRTRLTSLDGSHTQALSSTIQHHLLSLPTNFDPPATPDDTF